MLIRKAQRDTIPVVILAGFLGAGKTTILNHILRTAVGARIAVIVNDFGSVNIDSLLIAPQSDRKLELTNGCICCSMDGGELDESLATALMAKPDVVIVEASGLAEPVDLARMVILSPNSQVGYGGTVYAVDAVHYHESLQKHRRVAEHIELADLVVLTKVEQIGKAKAAALEEELAEKTKAPVVAVENGELAPELLFDIPKRQVVQPTLLQQEAYHHRHLHDEYRSTTFETAEPLNFEKFKEFMNRQPRGVYRIKSIAYFGVAGYEQRFVVQSVGGKWDMYAEEWPVGEAPHTTIVMIGTDFNESSVLADLHASVGGGGAMIDIQRYIRD